MHVDYMLNKNIHKSETFNVKEYEHNIGEKQITK